MDLERPLPKNLLLVGTFDRKKVQLDNHIRLDTERKRKSG